MDAVCVDVPERQDELQRQRSKRQPTSKPFATNPTASGEPSTSRGRTPNSIQLMPEQTLHNAIGVEYSSSDSN